MISCTAFAQQFTVASKISGIKESGLHSLTLTPEFRSYADVNIDGIRIFDSKKKEVPYWINTDRKSTAKYGFTAYQILYRKTVADTVSQIVIKNEKAVKWDDITLAIANTDARKTYSISGSNDDKQWFGLVNNQVLDGLSSADDTLVYKTLSMPVNAYRFLKISFSDKKTLPVNVIAVGKITGTLLPGILQEVHDPHIKILQLAIEKKTRITISFNNPVTVNQIVLNIAGPSLYNRNAVLLLPRTRKRRKKNIPYFEPAGNFMLSSSGKNVIDTELTESTFVLEIDNRDNAPLEIKSVKVLQAPVSLVADLKAGEEYTVKAGNIRLAAADYDLIDFKDSLPPVLPKATLLKPVSLVSQSKGINGGKSPWIMWACIAVGAVVLSYFCYSLVKDMKSNQNTGA